MSTTINYYSKPEDLAVITPLHLYLTLEHVKLGYWEMNPLTGAIHCTSTCRRALGIVSDEPFNYLDFLSLIFPEDLEYMQDEMQLAISGERSSYHAEYRIVHPDGQIRWIVANGLVIREGDEVKKVIGVTLDVTDHRQREGIPDFSSSGIPLGEN